MNLTAENTAIVLDSTSDFPEASKRFPNMRVVPLYVNFGAESFKDHVDIGSHDFYERLQEAPTLPTTSQPTPQDFLEAYEELAGYERIYSLQLSAKLSGTFQSAVARGRRGRRRADPRRRHRDGVPRGRPARARDPAPPRAGHDRRGDRATLIERFKRENGVVFTVATLEYLQKGGRIGRAQALAGHAAQREADPVRRRRRRSTRSARCVVARRRSRSSHASSPPSTEDGPG